MRPARPRPVKPEVKEENIPSSMKGYKQFVTWHAEDRNGKMTKIPFSPHNGKRAAVNAPDQWSTFEHAMKCHKFYYESSGIGFVLTGDDPFVALDFDHCIDDGKIDPEIEACVKQFGGYAEISPSGKGIRVIVLGKMEGAGKRTARVEIYQDGRYVTLTGNKLPFSKSEPEDAQAQIDELIAVIDEDRESGGDSSQDSQDESGDDKPSKKKSPLPVDVSDSKLIDHIKKSRQGQKFSQLWNGDASGYDSASEADLALCNILAFWTQGDRGRIDSLFRQSGLFRPKWDEVRGKTTYAAMTIAGALNGRDHFYTPNPVYEDDDSVPATKVKSSTVEIPDRKFTVDDICTMHDIKIAAGSITWLWEGWIQNRVVNCLAANAGRGKTRFVADIVRRICHQEPWPDGQPMNMPADTKVIWIMCDGQHCEMVTLCEDFDIMDAVYLNTSKKDPFGGISLDTVEDLANLAGRANALKPAMIIVDTTGGATDQNLCVQEKAKAFFGPLQAIAQKCETAILCITHLSATGSVLGRRTEDRVRSVIMIDHPDPNEDRDRVYVKKSNSKYPDPLGVLKGDHGNTYDNDPPVDVADEDEKSPRVRSPRKSPKTDACENWVVERLEEGPARVKDLIEEAKKLEEPYDIKMLYKVKDRLGLVEYKEANRVWWRLESDKPADSGF